MSGTCLIWPRDEGDSSESEIFKDLGRPLCPDGFSLEQREGHTCVLVGVWQRAQGQFPVLKLGSSRQHCPTDMKCKLYM